MPKSGLKSRSQLFLLAVCLVSSACSPPRKVAVEERVTLTQLEEVERIGGMHIRIVEPGDTVHAIAFANGLDAKKLAAWNAINDTSKLQVGQRLRLTRPQGFVAAPVPKTKAPKTKAPKTKAPKTKAPKTRVPETTEPRNKTTAAPAAQAPREKNKPAKPRHLSNTKSSSLAWRWPTTGRVVSTFNLQRGQQGIDIAGRLGQPVLATRRGEVVYVGNGLKGYGNLVIVKHDNEFLSAYAQNLETFVQEGQQLGAGERIATMGRLNNDFALHFQIRLNGEPVNPQRYLP